MDLNLLINDSDRITIEDSFIRIAKALLTDWMLVINNSEYMFTEIEFYYFKEKIHEDKSTHEHQVPVGKWRFHLQGLDISLGYGNDFDGGILIRGIKDGNRFINGPKRVLAV